MTTHTTRREAPDAAVPVVFSHAAADEPATRPAADSVAAHLPYVRFSATVPRQRP